MVGVRGKYGIGCVPLCNPEKDSEIGLINDLDSDDRDLFSRELRTDGYFKNFVKMAGLDFEFFIVKICLRIARKERFLQRFKVPFFRVLGKKGNIQLRYLLYNYIFDGRFFL